MAMLESKYKVKNFIIGEPKIYLGADVEKVLYVDGSYAWTMSSYLYVKEVIKNVKKRFKEGGMEYNKSLSDINYFPKNLF